MTVSLLQRILQERDEMRPAERRVADHVGAAPSDVIHMSMAKLSEICSVSDPTIVLKSWGTDTFQPNREESP